MQRAPDGDKGFVCRLSVNKGTHCSSAGTLMTRLRVLNDLAWLHDIQQYLGVNGVCEAFDMQGRVPVGHHHRTLVIHAAWWSMRLPAPEEELADSCRRLAL
jgi:hypothetical protein